MAKYIIFHNPKCSKSRQALALLESKADSLDIREYLDQPLNQKEIKDLLAAGDFEIKDLVRPKEAKEFSVDKNASDSELIKAIAKYPKIMQRPVVKKGKKAVIAREEGWFKKL